MNAAGDERKGERLLCRHNIIDVAEELTIR
jgi:hypothetical protein